MRTSAHGFTDKSFAFLDGLSDNNRADWFDENRKTYNDCLRDPFANLLEALSTRLEDAPVPLMGSSKTMFRINRDVRFSKDKSPYNTQVSGILTPSGAKSENVGVVYLMIGRDGGMMAAGWHNLKAADLAPFRETMRDHPKAFAQMKDALSQNALDFDRGNALIRMPRGFKDAEDHPHAAEIKLKSLMVQSDLPKVAWTSGDVIDRIEGFARAAMPLLEWGRKARA